MVIPLNVYFKVPIERLRKSGALNAYLGIDTHVFVDPSLLRSTKIPEFRDATNDFTGYFSPIIKLLKATKRIGDIAWETAVRKLRFHEEHGAALGYSAPGGSGRGIGEGLAELLAQRGKEIIDLGIDDPEIFEVIGLFQEGFGADLLSDMAVSILKSTFFA